jgi:1-deoxy-D-xylulose-5-phosphate synthase
MSEYKAGPLLSQIEHPEDLRTKMKVDQLPQVSQEVRQYIIDVISEIGNSHFGASLGVVELSVAIHYVFNTPHDQLIWDVGHQAYGHKILTGRRDLFKTNRQKEGISGFPKMSESDFDSFGVGHSSTSISAAIGMAVANNYQNVDKRHIAVIGDGAMTAGLAFEGLNHAGSISDCNLLVILNDNCMSIDDNVGALHGQLTPIKYANYFEALNFNYFGPIDGHDTIALVKKLDELKDISGPKILHVLTKKGKGFAPAEEGNATEWHSPGIFNKETGEIVKIIPEAPEPPKYQEVFGHTIVELAEKNDKIMGITPAMPTGSSLNIMMKAMPDRAFDVGIAEQHAVTFSAGLATQGMIPFCCIYSTFMQRAYDQVIHDVALQNLNVVFCLDRGGLVGADGATHHGAFDLAYMRCVPNMTVAAPMDEEELRNMMYTAQLESKGPFSIRYPRGRGVLTNWKTPFKELKIGEGRRITNGDNIAFLTIGSIGNTTQIALEQLKEKGISAAHYDMRFIKPLDELLLHEVFSKFEKVITVEDGILMGGLGSAVLEFMADHNYKSQVVRLGIPDEFIDHGTQDELHHDCFYDIEAQVSSAEKLMEGIVINASSLVG